MFKLLPQHYLVAEFLSRPRQYIRILKYKHIERHTLSTLAWSELWRICLIATLEPRYHPQNTSALPPPLGEDSSTRSSSLVMAHEDGNNLCLQHIFLSTMENILRSEAQRSEFSREPLFRLAGYDGSKLLRTHLLQIINSSTGQLTQQTIQRFLPALARQLMLERIEDIATMRCSPSDRW